MHSLFQGQSLSDTALTLSEEWGLAVIPLQPKEKKPLISWKDYQAVCPSSEQVEAWWEKWPNANIGLICGPHSNLLVLDCDSDEAVKWAKKHVIHTPLCVQTSRGVHWYFKWPKNTPISELKGLKEELKAKNIGLDLQITDQYVVGPTSVHPSGDIYTMIDYFGSSWLDDEVPEFILTAKDTQNVDLSGLDLSHIKNRMGDITTGDRNNAMTQLVGSLVSMGGSYPDVLREALAENQDHFVPPLSPKEVKTIVESVFRTDERNHGPRGQKVDGIQIDNSDLRPAKVEVKSFQEWPEEILHPGGLLEEIVDYTMDANPQTERIFAVAGALTLLSTVIGQRLVTTTGLPTGLYTVILGNSGTGKGAPLSVINKILHSDKSLAYAYAGTDVASGPSMINYLARQGCQRSLFSFDEFGMFLKGTKRSNSPTAGVIKNLTDMYGKRATEPYKKVYASEGNDTTIPWYSLSIFGASVPNEFWESLQNNEATNGFLARCMVFYQESKYKVPDIHRYDSAVPESIKEGVLALWNISGGEEVPDFVNGGYDLQPKAKPHQVPLSLEAEKFHIQKMTELGHKIEHYQNENNLMVVSIYNRTAAKAWQIALIHAASRLGPEVVNERIEKVDIEYGWKVVDEVDQRMIEQGLGNIAQSSMQALCLKVVRAIERKSIVCQIEKQAIVGASLRDISRSVKTASLKELQIALETLEAQGAICHTEKKGSVGRPVTIYHIAEIVAD